MAHTDRVGKTAKFGSMRVALARAHPARMTVRHVRVGRVAAVLRYPRSPYPSQYPGPPVAYAGPPASADYPYPPYPYGYRYGYQYPYYAYYAYYAVPWPRAGRPVLTMAASLFACRAVVAAFYSLPPKAFPPIHRVEGGLVGTVGHNRNGTEDLGLMLLGYRNSRSAPACHRVVYGGR